MVDRDEATPGEARGLAVSQADATGGESAPALVAGTRECDRALGVVLWNYLGTNEPELVKAWFEKVFTALRSGQPFEVIVNEGSITWASVR